MKYVPVDPTLYDGTWKGVYSTGEKFSFTLIQDNSFRVADTKFLLKKVGHAQIKMVVTNPATGASVLNTAFADLV